MLGGYEGCGRRGEYGFGLLLSRNWRGKRELISLFLLGLLGTRTAHGSHSNSPVFPLWQNSWLEPGFSDSLCFPGLSKDTQKRKRVIFSLLLLNSFLSSWGIEWGIYLSSAPPKIRFHVHFLSTPLDPQGTHGSWWEVPRKTLVNNSRDLNSGHQVTQFYWG